MGLDQLKIFTNLKILFDSLKLTVEMNHQETSLGFFYRTHCLYMVQALRLMVGDPHTVGDYQENLRIE